MKRALLYLSLVPILVAALAWVVWENRIDPSEADTAPRLSVQVCWPTAWGGSTAPSPGIMWSSLCQSRITLRKKALCPAGCRNI